jgi:hypothetical protein
MFPRSTLLCSVFLVCAVTAVAQGSIDNKVYQPSAEELAERKRVAELLRHPDFLSLRLLSNPRHAPRESSTDTPSPFRIKEYIGFRLMVSQSTFEEIPVPVFKWPYTEVRPMLLRDGEVVPYKKEAQTGVEGAESLFGPAHELKLKTGIEYQLEDIAMDDWYEPLAPGQYQLTVRRRFDWKGEWLTSPTISFEIQTWNAAPIPTGLEIELVPFEMDANKGGEPYHFPNEPDIMVIAVNKSNEPVKVNVIDFHYGNRPQLFKDGMLVPYRDEISKLINSQEQNPRLVDLWNDLFLDPGTRSQTSSINLEDWYGPLRPGSYRLINRRRFEIDGPWSVESAPLLFQLGPVKKRIN